MIKQKMHPTPLLAKKRKPKLINGNEDSLAIALAIIVLPQPGGPNNKTPFGGCDKFDLGIKSRRMIGVITVCLISLMIVSMPAISDHLISISSG